MEKERQKVAKMRHYKEVIKNIFRKDKSILSHFF